MIKSTVSFLILFLFLLSANRSYAQFNYGTGDITTVPNAAPFSTAGGFGVIVTGNDVEVTGYVFMAGGIYNFANFTVDSGATVKVTGSSPLIIRCTGIATINGTISASGGNAGGSTPGTFVGGNGGGQSGGAGNNSSMAGSNGISFPGTSGGGLGGTSNKSGGGGGYGSNGGMPSSGAGVGYAYGDPNLVNLVSGTNLPGGSGGGAGGSAANRASGGGGGGGGGLSITATNILIQTTGTGGLITVKGGNGGNGASGTGSGGGGAGGSLLLQYLTTLTFNGSAVIPINTTASTTATVGIDYSGGVGGKLLTTYGGDGGIGRYVAIKDVITGAEETQTKVSEVSIEPNPSEGLFHFSNLERNNTIAIYDEVGKMIYRNVAENNNQTIDLRGKANGLYFFTITKQGKQIQQGKLIVHQE